MAKRVALIPEELVSTYHLQKPEIRLETEIETLLEKSELPNDMKAKLLGQLITRYHKEIHKPAEAIRVSVVNDQQQQMQTSETEGETNDVTKDIMLSTAQRYSKFVPLIVDKLKSRQYSWNEWREMTVDGKPIRGSNVVDFFSYLLRNLKSTSEPKHFHHFLRALKEIRIPHTWVANKNVLKQIKDLSSDQSKSEDDNVFEEGDMPRPVFETFTKRREISSKSAKSSPRENLRWRAKSALSSGKKWLEY